MYAELKLKSIQQLKMAEKTHYSPPQEDQRLQHMPELEVLSSARLLCLRAGPSEATSCCTWAARRESARRPLGSLRSSSLGQPPFLPTAAGPLFPDEIQRRETWTARYKVQTNGIKSRLNVQILHVYEQACCFQRNKKTTTHLHKWLGFLHS